MNVALPEVTATFTPEEEKNLTALDAAAHDLMRVESRDKGEIPPCWLVCSDEIRATFRQRVIDLTVAHGGLLTSMVKPSALFERVVPRSLVEAWRAAELDAKVRRAGQDPRAYFFVS
jgi:hypothetical protein